MDAPEENCTISEAGKFCSYSSSKNRNDISSPVESEYTVRK